MKKYLFLLVLVFFFSLPIIFAHQPRIVYDKENVYEEIFNPQISQAFYGELKGNSDFYLINSKTDFVLYLNLLSPNISSARKDFSLIIFSKDKNLTITQNNWTYFYEEFGGDGYWKGPELEENVSAGNYLIKVTNPNNTGRYSLAVGKIESFPLKESMNAIYSVFLLKHNFFDKNYLAFFEGIIGKGIGLIFLMLVFLMFFIFYKLRKAIALTRN